MNNKVITFDESSNAVANHTTEERLQGYALSPVTTQWLKAYKHISEAQELCFIANADEYGEQSDRLNALNEAFAAVVKEWGRLLAETITANQEETHYLGI